MTRRHFEAFAIRKLILTSLVLVAGCTTPNIEDAVPIEPVSTAQSAVPGRPVPEDSRVFSDEEVDARTGELRSRSGRGGAGGGGDGSAARDRALESQDEVLRRIERSGE